MWGIFAVLFSCFTDNQFHSEDKFSGRKNSENERRPKNYRKSKNMDGRQLFWQKERNTNPNRHERSGQGSSFITDLSRTTVLVSKHETVESSERIKAPAMAVTTIDVNVDGRVGSDLSANNQITLCGLSQTRKNGTRTTETNTIGAFQYQDSTNNKGNLSENQVLSRVQSQNVSHCRKAKLEEMSAVNRHRLQKLLASTFGSRSTDISTASFFSMETISDTFVDMVDRWISEESLLEVLPDGVATSL